MKKNWESAEQHCNGEGGRLATPSTKAKNDFLMKHLENFKNLASFQFWFGATVPKASRYKAGWKFVSGERLTYNDWSNGIKKHNSYQPSGDGKCATYMLWHGLFQWNDAPCKNEYFFICEFPFIK